MSILWERTPTDTAACSGVEWRPIQNKTTNTYIIEITI